MDDFRLLVGRNLERARETVRMSQAEAAEQLGIDRPRLIGMEKGTRPVDASMLVQLARLYHTEVGQLVSEVKPAQDVEVLFRNCVDVELADAERHAVERFKLFCRRFARLLERAGKGERHARLIHVDPAASSRTRRYAVEGDAAQLRHLWDIGETTPVGSDIFWHLEEQGVSVYLDEVPSSQLAGASLRYPGLGAAMLVNTNDTPQRQAFTAAHELGHLIYHLGAHAGDCYVSKKLDKTADEQLANDFASAFLMPEGGIKRFLATSGRRDEQLTSEDVIALQRHFRVSYAAMLYRLRKLGIVKGGASFDQLMDVQPVLEAQRLGYFVQAWELRYRSTLQRPRGLPESFVNLVLQAYGNDEVNRGQAAEALELDPEAFQKYLIESRQRVDTSTLESELEDAAASIGG